MASTRVARPRSISSRVGEGGSRGSILKCVGTGPEINVTNSLVGFDWDTELAMYRSASPTRSLLLE
jgi:hypothetical protein